jgi:adenine-specific DNA-methyltransferase
MVRQTGDSIIGTLVDDKFIGRDNLHIILPSNQQFDIKFILGTINSHITDFYYSIMNPEKGEALAQVKKDHVENLPVPPLDFTDFKQKSLHDEIVSYVETMLSLKKQSAELPQEQEQLKNRIEYTDKKIDDLVYKLYGLTDEEVKIMEEEY